MATWTDKQLRGHKRAQGYISSAGATLGVAALGAAGLKSKQARAAGVKLARVANKKNPTVGSKVIRARQRAAGSATGLTTASAGVGGVGGFNFAAIQSQEARKTKVKKMDFEEFAKKDGRGKRTAQIAGGAALGAGGAYGAALGATAVRDGVSISRNHRPKLRAQLNAVRAGSEHAKLLRGNGRYIAGGAALAAGSAGAVAAGGKLLRDGTKKRPVAKSFEEFAKAKKQSEYINQYTSKEARTAARANMDRESKKGALIGGATGAAAGTAAVAGATGAIGVRQWRRATAKQQASQAKTISVQPRRTSRRVSSSTEVGRRGAPKLKVRRVNDYKSAKTTARAAGRMLKTKGVGVALVSGAGYGFSAGAIAGQKHGQKKARQQNEAAGYMKRRVSKADLTIKDRRQKQRRNSSVAGAGLAAATGALVFAPRSTQQSRGRVAADIAGVRGAYQQRKGMGVPLATRARAAGIDAKKAAKALPKSVKLSAIKPVAVGAGLGTVGAAIASNRHHQKKIEQSQTARRQKKATVGKNTSFEEFAKAFDPERSRKRRLEAYQAGANMTAGAAGFAGALKIKTQASNAKTALKSGGIKTTQLKAIGRQGAKGAGLLAAGAGAAVGAKKIGDHRKGKGRSYKALTLS